MCQFFAHNLAELHSLAQRGAAVVAVAVAGAKLRVLEPFVSEIAS